MNIVFFTGAGISVPSGIQPYRGPGGLWTEHPELEDMLHVDNLRKNGTAVWQAVEEMRREVTGKEPNAAHRAIAEMQRLDNVTVITQNIDGLHSMAELKNGPTEVLELHGNIHRKKCVNCGTICKPQDWFPEEPRCEICISDGDADTQNWRPDIVLFGEMLDPLVFNRAFDAAVKADVFIAVGTSATVSPANELLVIANDNCWAKKPSQFHIFDLEHTTDNHYPYAQYHLGDCAELLPAFLEDIDVR